MEQELSDAQWELIKPWLPDPKHRGRPRANDRRTINGILYVLRTSCRWQDLPQEYGSSVTCWRRLHQWQEQGVWEGIWRTLLAHLDSQGRLDWERAHLDATFAPAKRGGNEIGLTRKGKGTKLMLMVDNGGIPIGALVASAQRAEINLAEATLATVRVSQDLGRPRSRPKELVADRGYDSQPFRLRRRGIKPCIPERRGKKPRPGRKADVSNYSHRWVVERTFAWLHNFRRLVLRYERKAHNYFAFVLLAFIVLCTNRILKWLLGGNVYSSALDSMHPLAFAS